VAGIGACSLEIGRRNGCGAECYNSRGLLNSDLRFWPQRQTQLGLFKLVLFARKLLNGTKAGWLRCPSTISLGQWSSGMGNLLHYAIVFLVVALVAAFLGFGGVAGTAMEGARILFWVAIILFVVSLVANFLRRA